MLMTGWDYKGEEGASEGIDGEGADDRVEEGRGSEGAKESSMLLWVNEWRPKGGRSGWLGEG